MTPLFVPLCILLGRALERLLAGARLGWKSVSYVAAGMIVLILSAKLIAAIPEFPQDMTRLASHIYPHLAEQGDTTGIYSIGSSPLNGLEFHLQRLIIPVHIRDLPSHIRQQGTDKHRHLYLMKRKSWDRWKDQLPEGATTAEAGPHWLLVEYPGSVQIPGANDSKPAPAPEHSANESSDRQPP